MTSEPPKREGPPRRIYQSERDVTFIYWGGDAGLLRERGYCEVYEDDAIVTQIRH